MVDNNGQNGDKIGNIGDKKVKPCPIPLHHNIPVRGNWLLHGSCLLGSTGPAAWWGYTGGSTEMQYTNIV